MLPPLSAEPIFYLASMPITNAMINALIGVVFFVILALVLSRKRSMVPRGIQNVFESILELGLSFAEQVTGNRKTAERFFPLAMTLFLFILFSNWIGLLPGTGSIGVFQLHAGEVELIPLLRPASSDLNMTLAMAALSILMTHVFGVMAIGVWKHANKFINLRGIFHAFKKGPMAILVSLIEFGVGLIELVGEVAKTLSLSLRLFGNVFAGEVLLTVLAGLLAFGLPIPFLFLELLVGVIQATVFAVLVLAFGAVATMSPHGDSEEAH
ncbi:ATP synthase F0 subunit A [Candidatus Uhrbacteria bacterium CG10_big_fil_rev_8_21_14_0_10_50_16]|uniref:ATP synthase subunit a n=1 Tax=Candidatus Uhrbacteria bacterium CG10_big_fil_rev_8_21_14_0_10_50_16 TaxID=1975039 RepID=A0A2H0RMX9_9BACT|nr:MAG: ATP synthase F0 subunit A [Candidatus Uhrbacteria bacterium CG10_big_fil_rev_8_21_14_0_10_50_16]